MPPTRGCSHLMIGGTLVCTQTVVKGEPAGRGVGDRRGASGEGRQEALAEWEVPVQLRGNAGHVSFALRTNGSSGISAAGSASERHRTQSCEQ